ncbi:hypothetical protein CLV24_11441 [Pontibacter ummariensis]|uniref:Uncharacterized protein n=1 Tax=Pontibacter ummariensis TaxID=1610492 RepID=A0A239HL01_9BACT|nr:hypothetical protein [Pontibacter ummariensis]PRY10313.1 hypothetical protein CLV24_11441 [Pontibacter ummariensis]SNS82020.1 hypothetical protein SAMN06296052_11441 [Pontibacter ummariensis]
MKDQEININVTGETKELVIRKGEAAILREPEIVDVKGAITAPWEYLENKMDTLATHDETPYKLYYPENSTLYVDRENKKLTLLLNEKCPLGDTITGQLVASQELKLLEINSEKRWSVQELKRMLKQVRFMFANRDENLAIIAALDKFNATVTTNVAQHSSNRGDSLNSIERVVSGINWNNTFNLLVPIFKGGEKKKFLVEIAVDATDANVRFFLDSPDLYDLQAQVLEQALEEEVKYFREWGCSVVTIS